MKYVKYNLLADWTQPYPTLQWISNFEWWIIVNWNDYFWYIDNQEWIDACSQFNMVELTEQQSLNFFNNILQRTIIDINWTERTLQWISIWEDWKIKPNYV